MQLGTFLTGEVQGKVGSTRVLATHVCYAVLLMIFWNCDGLFTVSLPSKQQSHIQDFP